MGRHGCALLVSLVMLLGLPWFGRAQDKINFAHSSISGSQALLWVIQDAGLFRKNGLDVTIVFISGAPTVIKAMIAGDVPFGIIAGPSVVTADLEGADVVALATFVNTMEHSIFALPTITQPSDLNGKKIAVNRYGSSDDFGARFALKKWGLEPDREVALLQLGEQPARYSALQAKAVDATLLQPPLTATARRSGYTELKSLSELGLEYLGTSLVTTRTYIRSHESMVRRLVKAVVEGIHFYKTNRQASLQSIGRFMKVKDKDALDESYNQYALKFVERAPYPTVKGIGVILEDLAKKNPKAKGADPRSFIEARFIKELEDNGTIAALYREKK